jgi:hypothetical protein
VLLSLYFGARKSDNGDEYQFAKHALDLNGSNSYVRIGTNAIPLTGNFTIECWLNIPTDWTPRTQMLLSQATETNWPRFYLGIWGTGQVWVGDAWANTGAYLPIGGWHHLALVRNPTNTFVYIDGKFAGSRGYAISNPGPAPYTDIGQQFDNRRGFWQGAIAELRIWNTAQSESEIATLLHQRLTGRETGLVGYHSFDDGHGTIAANRAATGPRLNGNLVNGPTWISLATPTNRPRSTAKGP